MALLGPYAQPNDTMKNLLGITDAEELVVAERRLTTLRVLELHDGAAPAATRGGFDAEHLRAIHQHLFQDVYGWAGTTRGDPLTLEGQRLQQPSTLIKGMTEFEAPGRVNAQLDRLLSQLERDDHLRGLSREAFSDRAADLFGQLNQIHPFREGNGRTQREFMLQFAAQAGHAIQFQGVTQERITLASFDASQGDPSTIRRLFAEITDPDRARFLERGLDTLQARYGNGVDELYLATATPGREYAGQLHIKAGEHCILRGAGEIVVGQSRDLPRGAQPGAHVEMRASPFPTLAQEQQRQQGMEM